MRVFDLLLDWLFPVPEITPIISWIEVNDDYERWFDNL